MNILRPLTGWTRMLALSALAAAAGLSLIIAADTPRAGAQPPPIAPIPGGIIPRPDLTFFNGWVFYIDSTLITTFETVYGVSTGPGYYLIIEVKNSGTGRAGPFAVQVQSKSGVVLQTLVHNGWPLAPGQRVPFFHKLPHRGICGMALVERVIVVDSGNAVSESNEYNNSHFVQASYGPVPC